MQKRHFIGKPLILWPKKIDHYKTRLIEFGRFAETNRVARKVGKPETFNFLGFTHICAKKRSDGKFIVRRKTIGKKQTTKRN